MCRGAGVSEPDTQHLEYNEEMQFTPPSTPPAPHLQEGKSAGLEAKTRVKV